MFQTYGPVIMFRGAAFVCFAIFMLYMTVEQPWKVAHKSGDGHEHTATETTSLLASEANVSSSVEALGLLNNTSFGGRVGGLNLSSLSGNGRV